MLIEGVRLVLLPYRPEQLLALIEGVPQFEQKMGFRAAQGLRESMVSSDVSPDWLSRLHNATSADPWTLGFAVIHREQGLVIGSASFKGPPDRDGMVEIAYGIAPAYQNQGYATEAAEALVAYAFGSRRVRIVRAHTRERESASTHVLEHCGFSRVGQIQDPEDGPVWRWELRAAPSRNA